MLNVKCLRGEVPLISKNVLPVDSYKHIWGPGLISCTVGRKCPSYD